MRRNKALKQRLETRERTCIATGQAGSPEDFIRFVLGPGEIVAPDFSGKLPGRGAWVRAQRGAVETAMRKGAFGRSFKTAARAPDDLADRIDAEFEARALSALGLARRAGDVVVGFDQVKAALQAAKAAVLIAARDGAAGGRDKLRAAAGGAQIIALFDGAQLSGALGRQNVVHAAVKSGSAAERFLRAAQKLEAFRAGG